MTLLILAFFLSFLSDYSDPLFKPDLLVDTNSLYNRIWIYKSENKETGKATLNLMTGAKGIQSSMFLDTDDELAVESTKYYRLFKHFNPDAKKALMIGGGGFSYPKDFLKKNPEGTIDVVELDREITLLAKKYFRLGQSPRLSIYHQDGRVFVNGANTSYDAILIDAFHSSLAIPFQLTTVEFAQKLYDLLTSDGVVIMNTISAIEGAKGKFIRAEYYTFKQIFPQVYLFPVYNPKDGYSPKNVMLVALKMQERSKFESENEQLNALLANLWTREVEKDVPILTDDFAPVEQYVAEILTGI